MRIHELDLQYVLWTYFLLSINKTDDGVFYTNILGKKVLT